MADKEARVSWRMARGESEEEFHLGKISIKMTKWIPNLFIQSRLMILAHQHVLNFATLQLTYIYHEAFD